MGVPESVVLRLEKTHLNGDLALTTQSKWQQFYTAPFYCMVLRVRTVVRSVLAWTWQIEFADSICRLQPNQDVFHLMDPGNQIE